MNIKYTEIIKIGNCEVILLGIEVDDIKAYIDKLVKSVSDTSWITSLDKISQISYRANVDKTTDRLVDIFKKSKCKVNGEVGEYIVSLSSMDALEEKHNHIKIPLSELWKSKLIGNDGFDFHTVTELNNINFGEAKYNCRDNPYRVAAMQVKEFIKQDKDNADLIHLRNLEPIIGKTPIYVKDDFNYSISFSVNSNKLETILNNSLESEDVKDLIEKSKALFIIGVQIVTI